MIKRAIVSIRDLHKTYDEGARRRRIMARVNFDIYAGEFFVLLGASGSGKSTLLNLLSAIDSPTSGQICIGDTDITALNDLQQTRFRRDHIGIIFQFFNLIPTLTALENITLPQELGGSARGKIEAKARELLAEVGLADRADDYPDNLSGGEQQRVAICRALLHEPQIVLADEPTGNLDEDTGRAVIQLLLRLTRDAGKTLIMATHSAAIVPLAHRVCRIADGQVHIASNEPSASAARSAVKISNNALK